jgi:hypothetical protein
MIKHPKKDEMQSEPSIMETDVVEMKEDMKSSPPHDTTGSVASELNYEFKQFSTS